MRVLLCGAGQVGSLHAGNLVRAAGASEVLIADVDAARAEALALEVGARPAPVADPFSAEPDAVKEMDRQLSLTESVLRTKVLRRDGGKG